MSPGLTPHASEVKASGLREIFDLAAGRDDVLHLELGEPDFPTPEHVVAAAFDAARAGSGYTQTAGLPHVREAAAARIERVHGLSCDAQDVVITHGATQALALVIEAVVGVGDEVLLPDPAWPNYEMAVVARGGRCVRYRLRPENGFLPDPDEIADLISERTKLLILNTPGNPAGNVFAPGQLDRIVGIARNSDVLVLSDEVYDEILFDDNAPQSALRYDRDGVVGVFSCSKSYAMTGWRVGYLTANRALVSALIKLQEGTITCVSSVTQAAAAAALNGPQDVVAGMCRAYERRRDLVVGLLRRAGIEPVVPGGAFYLMLPLSSGADSRRAALDLVAHGVAVAPGTAFGTAARSHLRLSLARKEETLGAAIDRILPWYDKTEGGSLVG